MAIPGHAAGTKFSSRPAARRLQGQALEQRRAVRLRALDGQKRSLVTTPPLAEKPPILPPAAITRCRARRSEGIFPERLPDVARQRFISQPFGDFSISIVLPGGTVRVTA